MKLNLFEDKNCREEHVDVYFTNMRPVVRQIIDSVNSERPSFSGRPADEGKGYASIRDYSIGEYKTYSETTLGQLLQDLKRMGKRML